MFDEDTIMHSLQEVGVKLDELPLGAVTGEVVEKARDVLRRIKQHLESSSKKATGKSAAAQAKAVNAKQVWDQQLQSLAESFYLAIPSGRCWDLRLGPWAFPYRAKRGMLGARRRGSCLQTADNTN